jgi:calcineurin-like phosphoesterase family protein
MSKIFFTSDCHFNHLNVIQYDKRPFSTIEKMNDAIIKNHNEMVNDDDICYDLGDFYFRSGKQAGKEHYLHFLKQFKGRHVIIRGNHELRNKVIDAIQSATMFISGIKIFCTHDPMNTKVEYDLNIVGHVHNAFKYAELKEKNKKSLIINVGVSQWDYRPVEWRNIYALYCKWKSGKLETQEYDKKKVKEFRTAKKIKK